MNQQKKNVRGQNDDSAENQMKAQIANQDSVFINLLNDLQKTNSGLQNTISNLNARLERYEERELRLI